MIKEKFSFGATKDALNIRQKVFVDEEGFHDDEDEDDKTAITCVLYFDSVPIATARLVEIDPETYHLGRVCVIKEMRMKKIGTYLVRFMEVKARSLGARKILLSSQLDKAPFYSSIGYKELTGEVYLDQGYPHVDMGKILLKPKQNKRKRRY